MQPAGGSDSDAQAGLLVRFLRHGILLLRLRTPSQKAKLKCPGSFTVTPTSTFRDVLSKLAMA